MKLFILWIPCALTATFTFKFYGDSSCTGSTLGTFVEAGGCKSGLINETGFYRSSTLSCSSGSVTVNSCPSDCPDQGCFAVQEIATGQCVPNGAWFDRFDEDTASYPYASITCITTGSIVGMAIGGAVFLVVCAVLWRTVNKMDNALLPCANPVYEDAFARRCSCCYRTEEIRTRLRRPRYRTETQIKTERFECLACADERHGRKSGQASEGADGVVLAAVVGSEPACELCGGSGWRVEETRVMEQISEGEDVEERTEVVRKSRCFCCPARSRERAEVDDATPLLRS